MRRRNCWGMPSGSRAIARIASRHWRNASSVSEIDSSMKSCLTVFLRRIIRVPAPGVNEGFKDVILRLMGSHNSSGKLLKDSMSFFLICSFSPLE